MNVILNNTYTFIIILIFGNILMYSVNILINYLWSKHNNIENLKITTVDIKTTIMVLIINILISFPGYFLFRENYISFSENYFIRDIILLIIFFDFVMYCLHYLSHKVRFLKHLHNNHHTHKHFNELSLYKMSPFESLFFGILLTVSAFLFSFNFYSFIIFILFNWFYGVITHLNTNSNHKPILFGNTFFHKTHHITPNYNYGFYTIIWDRIFKTYKYL